LNDNDFCFISDLDEIWNPKKEIHYKNDYLFKLEQKVYAYYLNNRSNEPWLKAFAIKYKILKNKLISDLRKEGNVKYITIKNCGWHFTSQGGIEQIKNKIEAYSHQELNNNEIKSQIEKRIAENKDFIGRKFKFWEEENGLPDYILNNKEKYSHLFKKQ